MAGKNECTCKFCSESNVWRCKRCYNNIPAGLHGKYRQAVAAKSGEWSAGSSASSVEEGVQGGPSIPSGEGGDSEDVWGDCMEVEDEAGSRRKLDEQKKKLQKDIRDVDRLSFVSKEKQERVMESLQRQLQDVEKEEA